MNNWKQPISLQQVEETIGDDYLCVMLFVLILLRASNKKRTVKHKKYIIQIDVGQTIYGRTSWGKYFQCSPSTLDRALKRLQNMHSVINLNRKVTYTVITVKNYASWVSLSKENEQRVNSVRTACEQRVNTYKSVKSVKHDKPIHDEKTKNNLLGSNTKTDVGDSPDVDNRKSKKTIKFEKFIDWFNEQLGTRYRYTEKYKKKFEVRLKEGFNLDDMKKAVKNAMQNDFLMGKNDKNKRFLTPEYILRVGKLDDWLNAKPSKKKPSHETGRMV